MKLYPKQSVCPYCKTVYRFADAKKLVWEKQKECYHCHNTFRIVRKSILFLILEMMAVYAVLNLIAIGLIHTVSFVSLFVMNLIPAIAAILLFPFYIELKKTEKNNRKAKKVKK